MGELVEAAAALPRSAVRPADADSADRERLRRGLTRLRSLALLMDDRFELPVVRVRFGLDPLIGLIPAWGDWITWAISSYILLEAIRLGLPLRKLFVMALHVGVDLVTGYVPGIGDLIDVAYKANRRNVNIVLEHFGAQPIRFDKPLPGEAAAAQPQAVPQDAGSALPMPTQARPLSTTAASQDEALIELPADALDRRTSSLSRWLVGAGLLLLLAALAAVPFFLLWQLFAGG